MAPAIDLDRNVDAVDGGGYHGDSAADAVDSGGYHG
jgi:hypothetical protein